MHHLSSKSSHSGPSKSVLRIAFLLFVSCGLAGCDVLGCHGPETFVAEAAENPPVDFVDVPDAPLADPPAEVRKELAPEASEDESQAEEDELNKPAQKEGTSEPKGVSKREVGSADVEPTRTRSRRRVPNLGIKSKEVKPRKRRAIRRRRGPTESKAKKDSIPILINGQQMEPHEPKQARGDSIRSYREPSTSESVQNEVVFGPTDAEIAQYREERENRRRRIEARRAKREVIEAARQQTRPPSSATSTFAMDVDTGSYTLTAQKLARGQIPSADEVRTEEFINYFTYDYPPAEDAFGLTVEGALSPFRRHPDYYLVRFGLKARSRTPDERRPRHITVVVDVSGSMRGADSLPLVRKSVWTLLESLEPEDTVSLVSYATRVRLIASKVPVSQSAKLRRALNMLQAGGGSALHSGLAIAFQHARKSVDSTRNSRVVIFSDGAANIGTKSAERLSRQLEECENGHIGLTVLGVGAQVYNDRLLEALAARCDGRYHHVNSLPEAKRLFGEELEATLYAVAEDAKIQVIFESDTVHSFRRIGYDNRALPDEFFRRDEVDAGEVGAGESVTALYEIKLEIGASGKVGELRVRYNDPGGEEGRELASTFSTDDLRGAFSRASDDLRFAAALAGFAEILSRSALGYAMNIDAIIAVAEDASGDNHDRQSAVYLMRRLLEVNK